MEFLDDSNSEMNIMDTENVEKVWPICTECKMRLSPSLNDSEAVCMNPMGCRNYGRLVYPTYKADTDAYKLPPEVTIENIQAALPGENLYR